jgi:peptide/nickel transport system substrate-binding protein
MIAALLTAKTRPEVVSAVRALDRVLISGFYVVPGFYVPDQWIAHRTTLARPATTSLHGPVPETWWRSP